MNEPRVALISGASAGLGAAIARRLAARGDRVIITARRMDRLEELADELGRDLALPLRLDVQDSPGILNLVSSLRAPFAPIDILVNNAGLALGMGSAADADVQDWGEMIAVNCSGLVNLTRAVLPEMVARNCGHVVNLGSVAGTYPYPGGNVYGATKAFVHQFSLNLRADLLGTGVRVTCIQPGMCGDTEFSLVRFSGDAQQAARVYSGMQPIAPDDIAETVAWVTARPVHVNVNAVELMPVAQSFAAFAIHRESD